MNNIENKNTLINTSEKFRLDNIYIQDRYIELEPKVLGSFSPSNGTEAKLQFLNDDSLLCPDNIYSKLSSDNIHKSKLELDMFDAELHTSDLDVNSKLKNIYISGNKAYQSRYDFLMSAANYNECENPELKNSMTKKFMELNIELYNEPDQAVYRTLLNEQLQAAASGGLPPELSAIYNEIESIVGDVNKLDSSRLKPSQELVDFMHEGVNIMFGNFLEHIPDQSEFNAIETRDIFKDIVENEFYGAADDWKVELSDIKKSITVNNSKKTIYIPADRVPIERSKLKGLVIHEIGVHMMRSVMGEESGVSVLQLGMDGNSNTEEGIAMVLEQSVQSKIYETKENGYIAIGLAYYDNMNFRETFDVMWKLGLLEKVSEDKEVSQDLIDESKDYAYDVVQRIFRGTNDLPFFKDLTYYNGEMKVWEYIEHNKDDPDLFDKLLLAGKSDVLNKDHERVVYESKVNGYSN